MRPLNYPPGSILKPGLAPRGSLCALERAVPVKTCLCQLCQETLEPVQELRYLVEMQDVQAPLRQLPAVNGKPLRVCKACQGRIDADPVGFRAAVAEAVKAFRRRQRTGLLAAIGVCTF